MHAHTPSEHGRIETRKIWTTAALNGYLDFPYVGQAFVIEREAIEKKTGKHSREIAYGITSRPPVQADACSVLQVNRGHWAIENSCHYTLDWNYDKDRSRIRTGHGPENITRLRRFAIGVIKYKGVSSIAQKMRALTLIGLRLPAHDEKRLRRRRCLRSHRENKFTVEFLYPYHLMINDRL